LSRFKKNLTDNNNLTLSTIQNYFSNIRKNLQDKEDLLLNSLKEFHDSNTSKLDGEIKTNSDMIKRMEEEKVFVEQLKIKIDAKKVVSNMNENKSTTLPITYSFFKNDTIVEKINSDINVQEGTKKILFNNIKTGYLPSSTITVVDSSVINEEKVEERIEERVEERVEERNEERDNN